MSYAGRLGDVCRNKTRETGRWPNSFRLALEQGLLTEPAEILRLKASDVFPKRPKEESQPEPTVVGPGMESVEQTEGATEKTVGPWGADDWDFWETILLGLINPCYSPLSQ